MKNLLFAFFLFSLPLAAQQAAAPAQTAVTGQVTGHVTCADTGQAARFAGVQLIAEQPSQAPLFDPSSLGKDADFSKVLASAMTAVMKGGAGHSATTALDGSFTIDKVPPGTYYLVVQMPGYKTPLSGLSQMEKVRANAATMSAVENASAKVVVQSNQSVRADVQLERGASISGAIRYDDGSPAPSVAPVLLEQEKDGKWKELAPAGTMPTATDDRGHYRIAGLAAGKYAVKATLPTTQAMMGLGAGSFSLHMNMGDALVVYSGGALRQADIKPIEVGNGEEMTGVDVEFPLTGLHAVSGTVEAKADGHAVNSGTVELADSETKASVRSTTVEQDGSFHFNYVPDGSYLLRVTSANDSEGGGAGNDFARLLQTKVVKSYGSAEMPLDVKSDTAGMVIQVPDAGANTRPKRAPGAGGALSAPVMIPAPVH